MRKLFYIFILMLVCLSSAAIPARRGQWKTITLASGRQVKVELRGDESAHWWQDSAGQKYIMTSQSVGEEAVETWTRLEANGEEAFPAATAKRRSRRHTTGTLSSSTALRREANAYTGKRRGLILLVEFTNRTFREGNTRELFDDIANKKGFNKRGFKGSVSDYFLDQSGGRFELSFDVIGPLQVSNDYQYYGKNDKDGDDLHPGEMVAEACKLADEQIDFADYDWDGDGYVDQVVVIYAGLGEASGGNSNTIWPHEWDLLYSDYGNVLRLDKVRINTYACSPELGYGTQLDGIGTLCHEFSHCLGLPDMYDTNYDNYGMSYWDLMDYGSYNGDGFCPAGFTAYEKMFCGWQQPIVLTNDTVVATMEALSDGGDTYMICNDAFADEYYLLENRQKSGWDSDLYGHGLLITHIDYDADVWEWNAVNSLTTYYDNRYHSHVNDHQRCTIVPADNDTELSLSSLQGDPYPFLTNDSLTIRSIPAATLYNENSQGDKLLHVAIKQIKDNGDGTMAFLFEQRRGESSGIHRIRRSDDAAGEPIYTLEGTFVGTRREILPKGIYLTKGRKITIP